MDFAPVLNYTQFDDGTCKKNQVHLSRVCGMFLEASRTNYTWTVRCSKAPTSRDELLQAESQEERPGTYS